MTVEEQIKAQVEITFKQKAKFEALRYAPSRRDTGMGMTNPDRHLMASEIVEEAEKIYQWLIKDL